MLTDLKSEGKKTIVILIDFFDNRYKTDSFNRYES
jgi:hypothetical protein